MNREKVSTPSVEMEDLPSELPAIGVVEDNISISEDEEEIEIRRPAK